jgi:hypothetical protein
MEKCKICGVEHEFKCVLVKAMEFFKDGRVKRIEYLTPNDYPALQRNLQFEPHGTRQ